MGKISNAILLLDYLSTGNKYSAKELSDKIGVSERMIRYYKSELEKSGIYVEHFMGPNGGYFLNNNSILSWYCCTQVFVAYSSAGIPPRWLESFARFESGLPPLCAVNLLISSKEFDIIISFRKILKK